MLDELHLQLAGCVPRGLRAPLCDEIVRIVKHHHPAEPRNHLLQNLQALRGEIRKPAVDARESPSGLPEALDEAQGDRITTGVEHNGHSLCSSLDRKRDRAAHRKDQVDLLSFEIRCRLLHHLQISFPIAHVENELFPLLEAQLRETFPEPVDGCQVRASLEDDSDAIDAGLLRLDGLRACEEAAGHRAKERPPIHHWITSSARPSSDGGIVRPRALAVLRLMTSSNFVGCSMGRSPGFAPLRIMSTYVAARRNRSTAFGP